MRRTALPTALLALTLTACGPAEDPLFETRVLAFGTLVDLTTWGEEPELSQLAAETMSRELTTMNDDWHAWRPGVLGTFNEGLASGDPFEADPAILPLVEQARALADTSGHLFNPAMSRLFALWGFHRDEPQGPPPDAAAVAELLAAAPTMDDIQVDGTTVHCDNPEVQLDFGGFAKGYGVDRMIEMLQRLGLHNAIVNAGGDLRAIGRRGERPWRIGIRQPRGDGVLASVELGTDESAFTSGDYERYYEWEGERYHHIIDPRTGRPASGAMSVTVLHPRAAEADAAATALLVAGPDQWHTVAARMGIGYVMLVDAAGRVHMNPAMRERVRFEVSPPPEVIVSEELPPPAARHTPPARPPASG